MVAKVSGKRAAEQIKVQTDRDSSAALRGLASPPRQPKTGEVLAGQIRNMILRHELLPGDCLAPEPQLMEMFAASRATLREAFRILESERFISVRRGVRSGPQVHMPGPEMVARYAGYLLQYEGVTLEELYMVRVAVEPVAARLNAERADPEVVSQLGKKLNAFRSALADGDFDEMTLLGFDFHTSMVEFSSNKALSMQIRMLDALFERHVKMASKARSIMSNDSSTRLLRDFEWLASQFAQLIEYIDSGQADQAETFWRSHIQRATNVHLNTSPGRTLLDLLD